MSILLADWRTPVMLYIVLAFGLVRWMGKKYIVGDKRTKRLFLQFLVCFVVAVILAATQGQVLIAFEAAAIVWLVGLVNGVACFYSWKAQDISMGRSSVFTIWDDIIAMALSFVILDEGRHVNAWNGVGIVLSLIALSSFAIHAYHTKNKGGSDLPLKCIFYIGIYSVLWGIALFAQRYFSAEAIPFAPFALAWYGGSVLTAFALRMFVREEGPSQQGELTVRDNIITTAYSLLIILCLGTAYWSFKSPQVIVQPIYFVTEAIVPTAIALWCFNERKQFSTIEYVYLGIAIVGVILIFLGYAG